MNRAAILADLKIEEGFRKSAYQDHLGFWTIGYGTCIDERRGCGLTEAQAELIALCAMDEKAKALAERVPGWKQLSDRRQNALVLMAYQLGVNGVLNFRKMIAAMQAGNWAKAQAEALDSKWAREQTPKRAARVAEMILKG